MNILNVAFKTILSHVLNNREQKIFTRVDLIEKGETIGYVELFVKPHPKDIIYFEIKLKRLKKTTSYYCKFLIDKVAYWHHGCNGKLYGKKIKPL